MGKMPFIFPIQKTKKVPDLSDWGSLKNKFSGKTLFRSKLYYLVTGNLSALDIIGNKWFFEELLNYSRLTGDINMLPSLKKIAGSARYDESQRQSASEIAETIEDKSAKKKDISSAGTEKDDSARAENSLRILAGTRSPQTTEVLRLLRDKSTDFKRLALFLIGKFRMTDMIQDVCECLSINGLEDDAYSVILSFGSDAEKEISKFYLTASGNIVTRKILIRLLSQINTSAGKSFLPEQLWSSSRHIKEMVLDILLKSKYTLKKDETERLKNNIYETFGTLTWIISSLVSLSGNTNTILSAEMNKEYLRWKHYLLNLLTLTFDNKSIADEENKLRDGGNDLFKSIREMTGIIYDNAASQKPDDSTYPVYFKKKLKKLQHYFLCEIPEYKSLLEDIINCDYNLLSVWTKACTIRSIKEIDEEDLGESVVALLFSPEEVLREESARLIARSGRELYRTTAERIPEAARSRLDRIIAGESPENELVFEKAKFLSSCFPELNEDELLYLAEKTSFALNDKSGVYSQPSGTILWAFQEGKTKPEFFINHDDITDPGQHIKDIRDKCSFCYELTFKAVRDFNFQYPEKSFGIFRYIDEREE